MATFTRHYMVLKYWTSEMGWFRPAATVTPRVSDLTYRNMWHWGFANVVSDNFPFTLTYFWRQHTSILKTIMVSPVLPYMVKSRASLPPNMGSNHWSGSFYNRQSIKFYLFHLCYICPYAARHVLILWIINSPNYQSFPRQCSFAKFSRLGYFLKIVTVITQDIVQLNSLNNISVAWVQLGAGIARVEKVNYKWNNSIIPFCKWGGSSCCSYDNLHM
jgi:hypothetical protein